ncbi:MAG TPA: flagellar hook-length control protein FliK [Steroidobacteraceae bacterium]
MSGAADAANQAQMATQAMWLLVPLAAPNPAGPNTADAAADQSAGVSGTSSTLDGHASSAGASASAAAMVAASALPAQSASALASAATAGAAAATIAASAATGVNSHSADLSGGTNSSAASPDAATTGGTASSADLAALANLVGTLPNGAAQPGAAHSIPVPVSDPSWAHAVAAQVQLFAAANIQSATLRLSPEHLGPVSVHIDVQASQINVSFVAAHAETRSALEQSVPMLRAMLAHGGLTLGQAQVQGEARSGSQSLAARTRGAVNAALDTPAASGPPRAIGLIDEYA